MWAALCCVRKPAITHLFYTLGENLYLKNQGGRAAQVKHKAFNTMFPLFLTLKKPVRTIL